MSFRLRLPNAPAGLAQAAAAFTLAIVLLVLAASAPIHLAGIREDWQVAASLKVIGAVVSPQAFGTHMLCLRYLVIALCIGTAALLLLVYLFLDGRFRPRWLWLPAGSGGALMAVGLLGVDDGWAWTGWRGWSSSC